MQAYDDVGSKSFAITVKNTDNLFSKSHNNSLAQAHRMGFLYAV